MKTYKGPLKELPPNSIFVFGSNTQGRHGKGAALWAKEHAGAIYGRSLGYQGNSYAICTKDITSKYKRNHKAMPKSVIISQIITLYNFAISQKPLLQFYVAYMDAPNLNGYTPQEMADMFKAAGSIPNNIIFEESFTKLF